MDKFIDLIFGYKKIKLFYYLRTYLLQFTPSYYSRWYQKYLKNKFSSAEEMNLIEKRVNYYNKLSPNTAIGDSNVPISFLTRKNTKTVYYFDSVEYLNYFKETLKINILFGDITHTPETPSLVKSRPIFNNKNSIVLKLNKIRHFVFINDKVDYSDKKDQLIGRGHVVEQKALRVSFLEKHFDNPNCDIGQINDFGDNKWKVDFMPIYKQLEYKFILCWEGNDVASNLKYVMSSNSLAISTRPKYETWFMEGTLIGGVHYVEIKDDFSDLDEKLTYYSKNIDEAKKVIKNANAYTKKFQNKKREDLISILVLEKYFKNTNQILE